MNIKPFLLALCVALACVVPAFATNEENNPPEVSEPSEAVSEPIEEGSEFDDEISFGSELETVNISDESIAAIADAVVYASFVGDYEISDGFYVPSDLISSYDYYLFYRDGSYYFLALYSNNPNVTGFSVLDEPDGLYSCRNPIEGYKWSADPSYPYIGDFEDYTNVTSNFDVIDESGSVLHKSDFRIFDISFVTGFDDLEVESTTHLNPVIPSTLEYEGYIFQGWYLDPEFTELYTNGYEFTGDTILYAKFTAEPPAGIIHESIFAGITALFMCEPILYILSLMGLVILFACGRRLITSRL